MNGSIYQRITDMASDKGFSVNHIEKEAGLSKGSICKWERGSPNVTSLKKVTDFLGCTIDEIMADDVGE